MYPPITYELLKFKKACESQLALVKEHFGLEPIPLTDKVIEKFGLLFNIHWAAARLLTQVDLLEYNKVAASALAEYKKDVRLDWSEYDKVARLALAEYEKVVRLDWSEYDKVTRINWDDYEKAVRLALAEYNKVTKPALAEYKKVTEPTLAECRKVMAKELARLYKKGM